MRIWVTQFSPKSRRSDEVVRYQLGKRDKNKLRAFYNSCGLSARNAMRLTQHYADRLDSLRDGAAMLPRKSA